MAAIIRPLVLSLLLFTAGVVLWSYSRRVEHEPASQPFEWIADAHQLGPVGYRDPAGAISPDGRWIAYAEGRFLRVRPSGGGPIVDLPPAEAQIRNIAWDPESQRILADGFQTATGWAIYDRITESRRALWADRDPLHGGKISDLRQPAWSPDGRSIAAIVNGREGQDLWTIAADGSSGSAQRMTARVAFPAWTQPGALACVTTTDGRSRVTVPCGGAPLKTDPDLDVSGPIAFSPDAKTVYLSFVNPSGTVDLWAAPVAGGPARQLTRFSRDSYAPSVARDGSVVFKVQSYRTVVAVTPVEGGGQSRPLATFQSETPSWDPTGQFLGITYGTWRRVVDDAHYPDIAQDAGIIAVDPVRPAIQPTSVVHASVSEDQALCWSPNGKWIAFHSHKDQSDDIWLRPAAGATPPRRISFLGRGAEAGWPRWSPDGKWLLFDGASKTTHKSVMFVIGVDQESGTVTQAPTAISVRNLDAEVSHAEWLDNSRVIAISEEGAGRDVIFTVARTGGDARIVRRFASEHHAPGLAASPDGRQVAFIEAAPDGFFQVFRMPIGGGKPVQVTTDHTNKTQPAWSPDGRRLAFTVWNYDAQFWRLR